MWNFPRRYATPFSSFMYELAEDNAGLDFLRNVFL